MHRDEVKGKFKEMEGKVQQGLGDAFDSPVDEEEGAEKQVAGKFEQGVGKVKDTLHRAID